MVDSGTGRGSVAGKDGTETGKGDKEKERADKAEEPARLYQANLGYLFFRGENDCLEDILPAGTLHPVDSPAVTIFAPTARIAISSQVKTMVVLTLKNPYCHKT